MILSKIISVPNNSNVCKKHLNSWVLNLLMVFNSIFGFPLDNIKDILKYLVFGDTLKGAFLVKANLQGAYLWGVDIEKADLTGAYLWLAFLEGANLQGAFLEKADLTGAYLQGAYLQGAHLQGAHLQGAHLQGAQGLNSQRNSPK